MAGGNLGRLALHGPFLCKEEYSCFGRQCYNALPLPVSLRASSMGLGIPGTVVTLLTTLALGFLPHNGYGGMEQGEKWAALELGDL